MAITLMVVPADDHAKLNRVSLGLVKAFQQQGYKTNFLQPINQKPVKFSKIPETIDLTKPIDIRYAEHLLGQGWINELLEEIVSMHENLSQNAEIIVVQGLSYISDQFYVTELNEEIADALGAKIIIAATSNEKSHTFFADQIMITAHGYQNKNILGFIVEGVSVPAIYVPFSLKYIAHITPKRHHKIAKQASINFIANQIDMNWIKTVASTPFKPCLSPALFRHQLVQKARAANKKIILPEGDEIRIIKAAMICVRRKIAECILIGDDREIHKIAHKNGIELNKKIEIIEPNEELINRYIEPMVSLRKHKGLTFEQAKQSLHNNIVLATMMLQQNEIDGVVSGAVHTTADTIRPALQLIKTEPGVNLVSSIFFMCLPEQVLIYGDCAVNPNPNANELAEIAIESVKSAILFGIEPKVAMISYSTGTSGYGVDVDKVRQATEIVKSKHPDIIIDGPLQYDAALMEDVAKQKAPNSPVAGQATVCIFPDLDTGNAVYKAVQRSCNILSIGPMIQGLRKPVNDLSRGCSVEDVVFTIALTAIQAAHKTSNN
jgi:phosphate acetyltransferase